MVFDATMFGYGLGIVMSGWLAGQVVGIIYSVFRNAGRG